MKVAFVKLSRPTAGAVGIAVSDGGNLGKVGKAIDDLTGGVLSIAMKSEQFAGKIGQHVSVYGSVNSKLTRIVIFGIGKTSALTCQSIEEVGGNLLSNFVKENRLTLILENTLGSPSDVSELGASLVSGMVLKSYRFHKYFTKAKPEKKISLRNIYISVSAYSEARRVYKKYEAINSGVVLARDLVSEPANVLNPLSFSEIARQLAGDGLKVKVIGEKAMAKMGMGALLGVAQGSSFESKMVIMEWSGGAKGEPSVAMVGKGVCFDSGGISMKPPQGMWDMKWDMGGAAVVTGLMQSLKERRAPVNVIGAIGLVENMPDGNAQRPGDVVTAADGQTIEVLNTDAEGRLVLADVLWYVQNNYKTKSIIDLATLTGAVIGTFGNHYAGLFSNSDALSKELLKAGQQVNEKLWRLPMGPEYDRMIDSDIADVKNIGGRFAGAITAAQFLARFVNKGIPWAHLDIAGVTWRESNQALSQKGATGYGVRLLNKFLQITHETN
jgi:leucyl aminopeptidase